MNRLTHILHLLDQKNLSVMFLGMSGVGKTTIANRFDKKQWFHYSVDYRIGTRYLDEKIIDQVKKRLVKDDVIKALLQKDAITLHGNLTVDNLALLSEYVGMLGKTSLGGIEVNEFIDRQSQHYTAEIASINDIPEFQRKAREIYDYDHFLIDSSGSLAEIPLEVIATLADSTVIVYIEADDSHLETLIERAVQYPKPLYYDAEFLDTSIRQYCELTNLESASDFSPAEFVQWVFPKLVQHRIPRYQAIANNYGLTVPCADIANLTTSDEVLQLIRRMCETT